MHEIRVDIGEALELSLVDAGQNQAVRGCQRRRRPSEELVEVLAAAATLWKTPGGKRDWGTSRVTGTQKPAGVGKQELDRKPQFCSGKTWPL